MLVSLTQIGTVRRLRRQPANVAKACRFYKLPLRPHPPPQLWAALTRRGFPTKTPSATAVTVGGARIACAYVIAYIEIDVRQCPSVTTEFGVALEKPHLRKNLSGDSPSTRINARRIE